MRYADGAVVALGDIVIVPLPAGSAKARIVMLGETYDIDQGFLTWVKMEKILKGDSVVMEWIGPNPFVHNDPQHAPVGNYMFTASDECIKRPP